ncbi:hypothetical protein [Candidatus Thiodictyon syntrophicum]|uniref:Uncharacterized protein n=1 Tax=Candidatus Thiodictyon syntrophicum TaxID=1166950 RepID=A0A2K8UHL5_9GAMM|nr:hypothetical protein [Candidatus Thiodictyon syntrophicum]AUB85012.1 hypothetical protein THSYN_29160 [Candidatus Thiodictyon syntrophicum]
MPLLLEQSAEPAVLARIMPPGTHVRLMLAALLPFAACGLQWLLWGYIAPMPGSCFSRRPVRPVFRRDARVCRWESVAMSDAAEPRAAMPLKTFLRRLIWILPVLLPAAWLAYG